MSGETSNLAKLDEMKVPEEWERWAKQFIENNGEGPFEVEKELKYQLQILVKGGLRLVPKAYFELV